VNDADGNTRRTPSTSCEFGDRPGGPWHERSRQRPAGAHATPHKGRIAISFVKYADRHGHKTNDDAHALQKAWPVIPV
jgi:hypothetical protein